MNTEIQHLHGGKKKMSDTPRMVSVRRCQYENPNLPKYIVPYEDAAQLEHELIQCKSELAELKRWKSEMMEVESQWDVQAVGGAIEGLKLGEPIHPAILPYIRKLQRELTETRELHRSSCEIIEANARAHHNLMRELRKQRDMLAEALRGMLDLWDKVGGTYTFCAVEQSEQALAAVKGGKND
jgi:hypothetical protein